MSGAINGVGSAISSFGSVAGAIANPLISQAGLLVKGVSAVTASQSITPTAAPIVPTSANAQTAAAIQKVQAPQGQRATIMTGSAQGLDTSTANVARQTLLGS